MTSTATTATLPETLRLGAVELTVTDLDRAVAFYQDVLGMRVHQRSDDRAALGADEVVIALVEDAQARPAGRHAGLYHVALLYPTREELARTVQRLAITRTPIEGASDHGTHEAIYLPDPSGNGLELAADRPREQWPDVRSVAGYAGGPRPLDLHALLATVGEDNPPRHAEPGLRVGHLHLHVGDVEQGIAFYRDVIGFELMVNLGSAAFVSAGGYHHHLGFNVWRGQGAGPVPEGVVGLRHWTLALDTPEQVARVRARAAGHAVSDVDGGFAVRDPWGMELRVIAAH
jgi:catechol 2,3-dioxygenase